MEILTQKRVTNNGDGKGYFRNCVDYMYKDKLEPGEKRVMTKGYGVCDTNADYTYEQMRAVKKYHGKIGDNPLMHFVVSFDRRTVNDAETACKYTDQIAAFLKRDYQTIAAVHQENQGNSQFHSHFVVNSVNYKNGKLYHSGRKELGELAMHIHAITGGYCKAEIKK